MHFCPSLEFTYSASVKIPLSLNHASLNFKLKAVSPMHIHVCSNNSEAKYQLEPKVELVHGYHLNSKKIKILEQLIKV
jgi:hypothetical protein